MMKLSLVTCAFFAAANAQPELTSGPDNTMVIRRTAMTSLTDIDVRLERAEGNARTAAERAAYNATLMAMGTMTSSMNALQASVNEQMAAMRAEMSISVSTSEASVSTLASSLTASSLAATQSMTAAMEATQSELTRAQEASAQTVDDEIAAALTQITAVRSSVVVNTATLVAGSKVHMWTGGCSNRGHSGWQEYCLNQAHVNTAAPKFRVASSTKFAAITAGVFSMNFWVAYRSCNWQYQLLYFHNTYRVHGNQRSGIQEGGNSWHDSHQFAQWPLAAGQLFWGRSHSGCWYTWHSTNANGAHSRMTAIYQGQAAA